MEFEKRKEATLALMNSPEPDKSPKGTLDAPIIPLLNAINSHPSFVTTSSCSGRISILSQPTTATASAKKKAKGGTWVFITHDPADPESVLNLLFPPNSQNPPPESESDPHSLVFRFEPLIIAIECKDLACAQSLVSLAISCGFRESGITNVSKRVIIAIRCSIRLEVPLGDTHKIMVSAGYVRYLVEVANEKMEANRRRTDSFLNALLSSDFGKPGISPEIRENVKEDVEVDIKDGLIDVDGDVNTERREIDISHPGSLQVPDLSLTIVQMPIFGEPAERLFLWGHSACIINQAEQKKVLIFGGFGGMGRHARRNDTLLLDPVCGKLEAIQIPECPSPRMGHTCSVIGDYIYIIGGREDPASILNDVWVLDMVNNKWQLLQCVGNVFTPRHRHAAAAVGCNIYVFGGIHNDVISSTLYAFNTHTLEWNEICIQGEWPCPRHSHSLVAHGSQLYMFGGYDGSKALGDLYSFDVKKCLWKKEIMIGRTPYSRFSHSMFVYKNYLGIVGGCPVRQHYQELSLLDLQSHMWKHVMVSSVGKDLFVRSTAIVVEDDLLVIGGGASCYAFGTMFSGPIKMNLLSLISLDGILMPKDNAEKHIIYPEGDVIKKNEYSQFSHSSADVEEQVKNAGHLIFASDWVLKLEKRYAKLGKDLLKKFGWLDLGRKVYTLKDEICFPVTEKFCAVYHGTHDRYRDAVGVLDVLQLELVNGQGPCLKNISCLTALSFLMSCGAAKVADEVVRVRKTSKSPLTVVSEAVASLISRHGLPAELLEQLPTRWDRLGDMVVLPVTSFKDPVWDSIGEDLWPIVAKSLGTHRLARQGQIAPNGTRDSNLEILVGDNGWVNHRENGILYSFDATKCMFSWGNLSEKIRMGRLDCSNEVIVDLFTGIGYFVLPFLVRANAKLVYACEWNPHAIEALERNLHANSVADRCVILEGDNRFTAPKGVADRVCLGLLPTSEGSWATAVRALRSEGGILHVHGNAKDSEEGLWKERVSNSINHIARSEGYCWEVLIEHVERVKWYAPHIRHLVADVRCKQVRG